MLSFSAGQKPILPPKTGVSTLKYNSGVSGERLITGWVLSLKVESVAWS